LAAVDVDELESAESFELPGGDLSGQELSVRVFPGRADEFTCSSCGLVLQAALWSVIETVSTMCTDCAA
jgi:hypothetical protein